MYGKGQYWLTVFCLICMLFACSPQREIETTTVNDIQTPTIAMATKTGAPSPVFPTQTTNLVTITGVFAIIRNGETRYWITDDEEQITTLIIDNAIFIPFGGSFAVDRKRVTIVGEVVSESPRTVRVLSIQIASPG